MNLNNLLDKNRWKETGKSLVILPYIYLKNLIPQTDSQKDDYLNYLTAIKNYYQEQIENKTKVSLGKINIELTSQSALNFCYDYAIESLEKLKNENLSEKEYEIEISKIINFIPLSYIMAKPILYLASFTAKAYLTQEKSKIVFNDNYFNRIQKQIFNETDDIAMMHELSHHLWNKISKEDNSKLPKYKEWSEGFAEYSFFYFYDSLLPNSKGLLSLGKVYRTGLQKVNFIIDKFGKETYLEIPKKWQEFEKEFQEKHNKI